MAEVRSERDSMGERQLPQSVYYGIQTARALENFPISGLKPLPEYVEACVLIKKAAAEVNGELGCIPAEVAKAIVQAADEILQGSLRDQFVVDIYQAGAGTSHHMNVNEVLANRALEILGEPKGRYERVSPNDHVNYGQSTNDVIPTAIRLAALLRVRRDFLGTLDNLVAALEQKAQEFRGILKAGRTHLQDAVPVRLGDSFGAYAAIFAQHRRWIEEASQALCSLGLGEAPSAPASTLIPSTGKRWCNGWQSIPSCPSPLLPTPWRRCRAWPPLCICRDPCATWPKMASSWPTTCG